MLDLSPFDVQAASLGKLLEVSLQVGDRTSVEGFAFYNGRERWMGIIVRPSAMTENLVIIFGESRASDNLCVQSWEQSSYINPPSMKNMPEESFHGRVSFPAYSFNAALEHIHKLVNDYEDFVSTPQRSR